MAAAPLGGGGGGFDLLDGFGAAPAARYVLDFTRLYFAPKMADPSPRIIKRL